MTASGVALVLALLPLALACVNLPLYRAPRASGGRPHVSVLIPARNEAANIGDAVACVLAGTGADIELIVLDDHSTDATPAILARIDDPRLRVIHGAPLPPGWSGKQHACATLAAEARYDLLLFVDADVRLSPDAVSRMAGHMERTGLALASGFPRQVMRSWSERLLLPMIHVLLLGYLPMPLMRLSSLPGLGAGCGQVFIARRDAYARAGGHAAIRASLHDGIMLPRAFRAAGLMTGLFDATPLAVCRMYRDAAQVWEGLTKNATEGMAKPVALPVWTVVLGGGHVLPAALMIVSPDPTALAALAASFGLRALLAWRFRQPLADVALHPASVLATLVVQWSALVRAWRGRPATWRGRAYPAP